MVVHPGRPAEPQPLLLFVEDDPAAIRLAVEAAREARLDAFFAVVEGRPEAFQFLRRQGRYAKAPSPDVILLDLPPVDLRDLVAEISRDRELGVIPLVVLVHSEEQRRLLEAPVPDALEVVVKHHDLARFGRDLKAAFHRVARAIEEKRLSGILPILRRSDLK